MGLLRNTSPTTSCTFSTTFTPHTPPSLPPTQENAPKQQHTAVTEGRHASGHSSLAVHICIHVCVGEGEGGLCRQVPYLPVNTSGQQQQQQQPHGAVVEGPQSHQPMCSHNNITTQRYRQPTTPLTVYEQARFRGWSCSWAGVDDQTNPAQRTHQCLETHVHTTHTDPSKRTTIWAGRKGGEVFSPHAVLAQPSQTTLIN